MERDRGGRSEPTPEKRSLFAEGSLIDKAFKAMDRGGKYLQEKGVVKKTLGKFVDWLVPESQQRSQGQGTTNLPEDHPTKIPPYK
jgi:hypothetical protein